MTVGALNHWTMINVYIWADSIHSGLRSESSKLCALVIIGANGAVKGIYFQI